MKALRTRNGWTLAEVSKKTGVQVSTLSKLENGKLSFSYDKLLQISRGLNVDITELLAPKASAASSTKLVGRRCISRKGEGVTVASPVHTYKHVATELLSRQLAPMIGEIKARSVGEYSEFQTHCGEEYVYVLEGILELHTSLYAPVRLEEGDSIYFDSEMPHAYVSVGTKPCRILSVCAAADGGDVGADLPQ